MNSPLRPKILFLVAHPYLERSRANRSVIESVRDLRGLTLHKIYDHYPYFHIDVERERSLLLDHDIYVMQHPSYWYNMPALLKLWLDEVLESGFAYGPGGDKLKGKKLQLSLTVGEPHSCSVDSLLAPWRQIVELCQMQWLEPLVVYDSIAADISHLREHGRHVRKAMESFLGREGHA